MFTPAGLATYLTGSDDRRVGVSIGHRTIYVTADDLTCRSCGGPIDVVDDAPVKFLAFNALLNAGLCAACDASDGD